MTQASTVLTASTRRRWYILFVLCGFLWTEVAYRSGLTGWAYFAPLLALAGAGLWWIWRNVAFDWEYETPWHVTAAAWFIGLCITTVHTRWVAVLPWADAWRIGGSIACAVPMLAVYIFVLWPVRRSPETLVPLFFYTVWFVGMSVNEVFGDHTMARLLDFGWVVLLAMFLAIAGGFGPEFSKQVDQLFKRRAQKSDAHGGAKLSDRPSGGGQLSKD